MIEEMQAKTILLENKQGRPLWHLDALLSFKALSTETNAQFWAAEGLADSRMAVPLHLHTQEDEFWFVLEGEFRFTIGDQTSTGGPGTFIYIPRNVPHSFQVLSATGRWLGGGIGSGFDQWFFETGEPAQTLTLPPASVVPPNVEVLVSSLKEYHTEVLGPPPGLNQ